MSAHPQSTNFPLKSSLIAVYTLIPILLLACSQAPVVGPRESTASTSQPAGAGDRKHLKLAQIGPAPTFPEAVAAPAHGAPSDSRAARQLERGRKRFEEQHWAEAMTALEKAVQFDPSLTEARLLYARAAIRLGNLAAAREQVAAAMTREPRSSTAHWLLGELASREQKAEEAIAEFRLAIAAGGDGLSPEVVLSRLSLAQVLQREGYLAAAAEQFEAYASATTRPTPSMLDHLELNDAMELYRGKAFAIAGDLHDSLGRPEQALTAYERALLERPDDAALTRKRIMAMAKSGRGDEAIAAARAFTSVKGPEGSLEFLKEVCDLAGRPERYDAELTALAASAQDEKTILGLSRLLVERGKRGEAVSLLESAMGREPSPALCLELARLQIDGGEHAKAYSVLLKLARRSPEELERIGPIVLRPAFLDVARQAAEASPKDGIARFIYGRLLAGRRDYAGATNEFRAVLGIDPGFDAATAALAECLCGQKKWPEAIRSADAAIKSGVQSAGVWMAKADAHAALDQDEEAENAYLAAFDADKTSGEALYRLAQLASRRGQHRRVEQLYRRILDDVDPRHAKAREKIVAHYLNRGEIDQCREYFGDFAALGIQGPSEGRSRAMLALTTSGADTPRGRLNEYLAALRKILEKYPDDADTFVEIARSYAAVNDNNEALASVDQALAINPEDIPARELKAALLAKLLRFGEASVVVRGLLADRPRDMGYLQDLLRFADNEGDWDTVASLLREFLTRDDLKEQQSSFTSMLISALVHAERWDEAVEVAKGWLDDSPDDVVRRGTYLATLGRAKRHDEAVSVAREYLKKEPDNRVSQMSLLHRLQEAKRYTEALQLTLGWLAKEADDVDLNMALVRLCWSARRWDDAIEVARMNSERSESRTTFETLLGDTYRFARRYDEAVALFKNRAAAAERRRRSLSEELARGAGVQRERALLLQINEAISEARHANYQVIGVLIAAERYGQAERAVNKMLRPELEARDARQPFDSELVKDLRYLLSEIYQDTDRLSQSVQQLEAVYEMDPEDAGINNNLGYTLVDHGLDLDRGERMIRLSLAQNPKSHASLDSLGWVLYKRGKYDDAVYYLRQALNIASGEEPVLHDHLGDALYRRGDKKAAEAEWKKARDMCAPDHDPPPDRDRRLLFESLSEKLSVLAAGGEVTTSPIGGVTTQPSGANE